MANYTIRFNMQNKYLSYSKLEQTKLVYLGEEHGDVYLDCVPSIEYYVDMLEDLDSYTGVEYPFDVHSVGSIRYSVKIGDRKKIEAFFTHRLHYCTEHELDDPNY